MYLSLTGRLCTYVICYMCFSVAVCKHASKACDSVDALESNVQSANGGVCEWAWSTCVAEKMSLDEASHKGGKCGFDNRQ